MVSFNDLEALVAFSESGTLTSVADKLGVSQSALTRSMQKIERETGIDLFSRTGNSIRLNPAGVMAADYARKILCEKHDMFNDLRSSFMPLTELSVGICSLSTRLSDSLHELFDNSAKYKLTLSYQQESQLFAGLNSQKYQLVVTSEIPDNGRYSCHELCSEELALALPLSHRLSGRDSVSLDELSGDDILIYHEDILYWRRLLKSRITGSKLIELKTGYALKELAKSSSLPCIASPEQLSQFSAANRRILSISDKAAYVCYYLICRSDSASKYGRLFQGCLS